MCTAFLEKARKMGSQEHEKFAVVMLLSVMLLACLLIALGLIIDIFN